MNIFTRNDSLEIGSTVYYYPQSQLKNGLQACVILEKLDVSKHGFHGPLTHYLVECSSHVDSFLLMKTNMQLYTKEQKDAVK